MENIKIPKLIIFARSVINIFARTALSIFIIKAISSVIFLKFVDLRYISITWVDCDFKNVLTYEINVLNALIY